MTRRDRHTNTEAAQERAEASAGSSGGLSSGLLASAMAGVLVLDAGAVLARSPSPSASKHTHTHTPPPGLRGPSSLQGRGGEGCVQGRPWELSVAAT